MHLNIKQKLDVFLNMLLKFEIIRTRIRLLDDINFLKYTINLKWYNDIFVTPCIIPNVNKKK